MRRVKQTTNPPPKAVPSTDVARAQRSIAFSELPENMREQLTTAEWLPNKHRKGTWNVGGYFVENSGSTLLIHRYWSIPLRF